MCILLASDDTEMINMHRKKIKWILVLTLLVFVLVLPMFVTNPGVRINPITHTVFKLSAEDDIVIALDGGAESWYVELTGEEREKAIEIIKASIDNYVVEFCR